MEASNTSSTADLSKKLCAQFKTKNSGFNDYVFEKWKQINGDVERNHTIKVFIHWREKLILRGKQNTKRPFDLIIYVDSQARVTDFNAQREIYKVRLEQYNITPIEIIFRYQRRDSQVDENAGFDEKEFKTSYYDQVNEAMEQLSLNEEEQAEQQKLIDDNLHNANRDLLDIDPLFREAYRDFIAASYKRGLAQANVTQNDSNPK